MHILLVEDDRLMASSLAQSLAAEGYAVEIATDGSTACTWPAGATTTR